jgi:hypothetical protein
MFAARPPEDEDRPRPRVVVLQQIDGPPDLVPPDLSVFAWKLLAKGADAVVAYQFPLPGQLSKAFNKEFYTQLAAGEPFETAVQKARILLWAIEPERHPYLSPAAFVAQPGELRLTAAPRPSAPIARVGVTGAQAGVGVYVPPLNPVGARGR